MVAEDEEATVAAVTVTVAVLVPAATVTVAGTVATDVFELARKMTAPPAGAFPFSVTVAVDVPALTTLTGFRDSRAAATVGVTRTETWRETPLRVAVIAAEEAETTVLAVTVKVAVVALNATVMLAGTVATPVSELVSATAAPPAGAGAFSRTVAVTVVAERALGAASVRPLSVGEGVTSRGAVWFVALYTAVTVTASATATVSARTVNPAAVAPAGTVTVAGTVAADLSELASATGAPPVGAGPERLTTPSTPSPLETLD